MQDYPVTATLRYMAPGTENPVYYASTGGVRDSHDKGIGLESLEVAIHNARAKQPPPDLDREGFTLVPHKTAISDFYRLDAQKELYEKNIIELVVDRTGAAGALAFDHTLRSDSAEIRGTRTTREPADFVHNDYTDRSACNRVRDLLPAAEAEQRLERRFAIVNVWRSINGTVYSSPMTCCDASTIDPGDRVPVERRAQDRIGEVEFITWNPRHRWYCYPEMTMEEALLIKTFDSSADGRATRSVHTSFDNPLTPAGAPARESIESRLLVLFD